MKYILSKAPDIKEWGVKYKKEFVSSPRKQRGRYVGTGSYRWKYQDITGTICSASTEIMKYMVYDYKYFDKLNEAIRELKPDLEERINVNLSIPSTEIYEPLTLEKLNIMEDLINKEYENINIKLSTGYSGYDNWIGYVDSKESIDKLIEMGSYDATKYLISITTDNYLKGWSMRQIDIMDYLYEKGADPMEVWKIFGRTKQLNILGRDWLKQKKIQLMKKEVFSFEEFKKFNI